MLNFLLLLLLSLRLGAAAPAPTPRQDAGNSSATPTSANLTLARAVIRPSSANGSAISVWGTAGFGVTSFVGIPFAEPPVGELRFAPPRPKMYNSSILTAIRPGPACMQDDNPSITYGAGSNGISEDCLTLNIMGPMPGIAPSNSTMSVNEFVADPNSTETSAGLPVMVWIHGGAFTAGNGPMYLSPFLVNYASQVMGKPVILVTIQYRLGIFGWGYGQEVAENGAANLGLRDQTLALEWVRENIASFGGDPSKVTVFGHSAGAISISLLMLNESVDLFRGAIMQSGAQSSLPLGPTGELRQRPYDVLTALVGCGNTTILDGLNVTLPNADAASAANLTAANSTLEGPPNTAKDSLACLKNVPAEKINNATLMLENLIPLLGTTLLWGPSVDGDLVTASPHTLLENGSFARIPFITGNVRDEGTMFVPPTINSSEVSAAQFINLMNPTPIDNATLARILAQYPNDPALGSPFGTGNETFGLDPMFKQLAAIFGDSSFQSRRRWFLRQANSNGFNNTWTYEFVGRVPVSSNSTGAANIFEGSAFMGTAHGFDVMYALGAASTAANYTAEEVALSEQVMTYWVNFAYALDPNGANGDAKSQSSNSSSLPYWYPHTYPANKNLLLLQPGNTTMVPDDFREDRVSVFNDPEIVPQLHAKRDV